MVNATNSGSEFPSFRYVIIGAGGGIATTHLRALSLLPNVLIVGLSDVSLDRVTPRAIEIGCHAFADHREMLSTLKPDVAVICTPHPSHRELVIDSLQAGAHVLVEKPLAVEVAEGDAIIMAAEAANRLVGVSFQHRFDVPVERIKEIIDTGQLGSLVRVLCIEPWFRTDTYYRSASWRGTWTGEAGGVLMNQAPHPLDLLCHFVGLPVRLWGRIRTVAHHIETEDSAQAMFEYANGASGYLQIDTVEVGQRRLEIVGDRAALEWRGNQLVLHRFNPSLSEYRTTSSEMWGSPQIGSEAVAVIGEDGGHVAVHQDFQTAIFERRRPRCDARDALQSLELANAVTLSSLMGTMVELPLDRTAYSTLLAELQQGKRTLR